MIAAQIRQRMPPKNIATADQREERRRRPEIGLHDDHSNGTPTMSMARANDLKSMYARSSLSKNFASMIAVKIFMNSDG